MGSVEKTSDAWLRTVQALVAFSKSSAYMGMTDFTKPIRGGAPSDWTHGQKVRSFNLDSGEERHLPTAVIKIIERPTNSTIVVHWTDPGKCLYGYQLWHRARARRNGYCALSGEPVRKHDEVYRPWWSRSEPQNSREVILQAAVYRMSGNSSGARGAPVR